MFYSFLLNLHMTHIAAVKGSVSSRQSVGSLALLLHLKPSHLGLLAFLYECWSS